MSINGKVIRGGREEGSATELYPCYEVRVREDYDDDDGEDYDYHDDVNDDDDDDDGDDDG